jgi:hypothetical protein
MACAAANIEPLIATGRQPHHPSWRERFAAPPPAPVVAIDQLVCQQPSVQLGRAVAFHHFRDQLCVPGSNGRP